MELFISTTVIDHSQLYITIDAPHRLSNNRHAADHLTRFCGGVVTLPTNARPNADKYNWRGSFHTKVNGRNLAVAVFY